MQDILREIMTFKTLWALCTVGKEGQMRAVYYAVCLSGGRNTTWGLWNMNAKFLHFAPSREALGRMHPKLTWRRIMARWQLQDDTDWRAQKRRLALSVELDAPLPTETKQALEQRKGITLQLH